MWQNRNAIFNKKISDHRKRFFPNSEQPTDPVSLSILLQRNPVNWAELSWPYDGEQTPCRLSAVHQPVQWRGAGPLPSSLSGPSVGGTEWPGTRRGCTCQLHVPNVCSGWGREICTGWSVCSAKCVHVCSRPFIIVNLPRTAFEIRSIDVSLALQYPLI